MKKIIEFVESKITGGHLAFKNPGSSKPFTNKLTEAKMINLLPTDVVVDIGGYVGEYTLYAAKHGCKVFTYEPTPDTFEVLLKNTKKFPNVKCTNAAVTGGGHKFVTLNVSPGIGVTNSIVQEGKDHQIKVKAVDYSKITKDATVVKIDCEGAEYSFNIVSPKLRAIILEVHPIGKDWKKRATNIFKLIEAKGFKALVKPKFKNGWDMHATFVKGNNDPYQPEAETFVDTSKSIHAKHWRGMPEFTQEDAQAYQKVVVNFTCEEDVLRFFKLINQRYTKKTRSIWFPEVDEKKYIDKRYSDKKKTK